MIRYRCPHCERVCESAEVLRGFSVICLGCSQSVPVPDESSLADEVSPSRLALPEPPPLVRSPDPVGGERSPVALASPMPANKPRAFAAPKPIMKASPSSSPNRRWIVRGGVLALLAVLLVAGGMFGRNWYRQRQETKARLASRAKMAALQDAIRENFNAAALKKLAAKPVQWNFTPTGPIRIKGKLVVLAVTEAADAPRGFWAALLSRWPRSIDDDAGLVHDVLERGDVDDLMFKLPDERWAEGIGEVDTLIAVRWSREIAGTFNGETLIETSDRRGAPRERLAMRWRATILILDRTEGQLIARQEFVGSLPKKPPVSEQRVSTGSRPTEEVLDWLLKAESGALKLARS